MPFGLTGAPTTFCEMVAIALKDLLDNDWVNWMDDLCTASDDFDTKMERLGCLFEKCRTRRLSLAPAKCKLFQTEVVFAGATLSKEGIKPNRNKIAAVVDWPEPRNARELSSFLGLTNYFRRMIKDYARIMAPLSDLIRDIGGHTPRQKAKRGVFKQALESTSLEGRWERKQTEVFLKIKIILTTEPVLKPPQYDGRPFKVTTDGSILGFGGMVCQEFEHTDNNGNTTKNWHPIAFCSKRTSRAEEKYKQFILEFAALKFCLDEFNPMTFGSPIILETDCLALRDLLRRERRALRTRDGSTLFWTTR